MIGQVFHKLTVISRAPATAGNRGARWHCECECGNKTISRSDALKNGRTKSCGCHRAEMGGNRLIEMNTSHGMYGTAEHRTWLSMKSRCNSDDPNYGGRGISVCDAWQDFEQFYADMGDRPEGHSIERLDVNGDYSPENCVWADSKAQANNKRNNLVITYDGQKKTLAEWARQFSIPYWKLNQRLLRDGLTFEQAIIDNDRRYKGVIA